MTKRIRRWVWEIEFKGSAHRGFLDITTGTFEEMLVQLEERECCLPFKVKEITIRQIRGLKSAGGAK